jgi:RNA polymerase sigma-70 factor, ECF subfamily
MLDTLTKSDEQLVALFQAAGEPAPIEELLGRYLARINALIFPMVLDETVADDLTQEVFLRTFRGLRAFRAKASFSTWLYRIAMNTTYGYLRLRKREHLTYGIVGSHPDSDHRGPERLALQAELDVEIRAALAGLSPRLRAALVLTTMQDLSPREASRIEHCSTATMYWRIHEARKQIRCRLERYLSL